MGQRHGIPILNINARYGDATRNILKKKILAKLLIYMKKILRRLL